MPHVLSDDQVLTFTQAEKDEMRLIGHKYVNTIHEYQGKEAMTVRLVRLQSKPLPIYESLPHIIVALTRHTRNFIYSTINQDDKLVTLIKSNYGVDLNRYVYSKGGGAVKKLEGWNTYIPRNYIPREVQLYSAEHYLPDCAPTMPFTIADLNEDGSLNSAVPYLDYTMDIEADVPLLQWYYDQLYPGNSYHYDEHDAQMVEECDIESTLPLFPMTWSHSELPGTLPWYDHMVPVLKTSVPRIRPSTQTQSKLALFKRNLNPPVLSTIIDVDREVDRMVSAFKKTYVVDGFDYSLFDEISFSKEETTAWFFALPEETREQIVEDIPWEYRDLTLYNYIIKRQAKPVLDRTSVFDYPALQTITYHPKDVNAFFCPLFRMIKKRLNACLKNTFALFTDMTLEAFEEKLNTDFDCVHLDRVEDRAPSCGDTTSQKTHLIQVSSRVDLGSRHL